MKRVLFLFLLVFYVGIMAFAQSSASYVIQEGESINEFWGRGAKFFEISNNSVVSCVATSSNGEYFRITGLKSSYATIKFGTSINTESGIVTNVRYTLSITVLGVNSISLPSTLSLSCGENYTFTPSILDVGAATTLTWYSSNTNVATINSSGFLITTGLGTTTITCTAHNGVSAQCVVTVNPVLVSGIVLNENVAELKVGEKLQLEATVAPENATDKSVTWSSTNEAVALVTENGKVFAVGLGFCQIKATANDGSGKYASCIIEVSNSVPGDMDGDGKVTIADAVKVIDLILEKE